MAKKLSEHQKAVQNYERRVRDAERRIEAILDELGIEGIKIEVPKVENYKRLRTRTLNSLTRNRILYDATETHATGEDVTTLPLKYLKQSLSKYKKAGAVAESIGAPALSFDWFPATEEGAERLVKYYHKATKPETYKAKMTLFRSNLIERGIQYLSDKPVTIIVDVGNRMLSEIPNIQSYVVPWTKSELTTMNTTGKVKLSISDKDVALAWISIDKNVWSVIARIEVARSELKRWKRSNQFELNIFYAGGSNIAVVEDTYDKLLKGAGWLGLPSHNYSITGGTTNVSTT